jgi:predicted ATPase
MIRELTIKNYKSIFDHTIELGRINVFIGENGCGKTNILEALAMAAAALTDKLSAEELFNRGMRVAKPSIMRSSFPGAASAEIMLGFGFESEHGDGHRTVELRISADESQAAEVKWSELDAPKETVVKVGKESEVRKLIDVLEQLKNKEHTEEQLKASAAALRSALESELSQAETLVQELLEQQGRAELRGRLGAFSVYEANSLALRGLMTMSRKTPLGIYGETLDYAISKLKPEIWADILERARCISWLDNIVVDVADALKLEGHKLGQGQSTLYFYDKFMGEKNNIFSAENVNEGILHILFYLTLFVSEGTPKVLGIDNIETALNPQLCRDLMEQLADLAVKHDKQVLITTHNPAILDGLNLHDPEQRLFVVSRNDEGHTVTERISLKPKVQGAQFKYKLSEMWMRGLIGGLPPERF